MKTAPGLIVIGGGAAGFFCAVNAARQNPSLRVMIAEKSGKLLSKVKISGGSRCNVTHDCTDIHTLLEHYPRGKNFLKRSLPQFMPADTVRWFAARGVTLKTEADGRMFPLSDRSQSIIDCLLQEAERHGVKIYTGSEAIALSRQDDNRWKVSFKNGEASITDFVCIAGGGQTRPEQFAWLQALGHSIEAPAPSLFTFNLPDHPIRQLQGVSVGNALVKIQGSRLAENGPVLITHWGLSGPAVLKLSAWGARLLQEKNYHFTIQVNWLPAYHENSLRDAILSLRSGIGSHRLNTRNPFALPQRLWEFLVVQAGLQTDMRWAEMPSQAQNRLIRLLTACEFEVKGKTTFKEEFVTCGGIRLSEIDPHSMQSRKQPGLFFAGEIMDVDGVTGGFNFQHAWSSGWIAAKSIARASLEAAQEDIHSRHP